MAIEAMVEAAMACAGREDLPVLQNIEFRRPLIVPEDAKIAMRTLALADEPVRNIVRVHVAIRSDADNFKEDHFSAECVFGLETLREADLPLLPHVPEPLAQSPEDFSPVPLFQGKFFRRITAIRTLEMGKESLTDIQVPDGARYYNDHHEQNTLTPSPAARDAFLQSGALILPPGCLPESIEEIRFHRSTPPEARLLCHILVQPKPDGVFIVNAFVFTPEGNVVETLRNVALRAPKVGQRVLAKSAMTLIPLSRVADDLRALLSKVFHAIEIVDHRELQNLADMSELTQEDVDQIRASIPVPRQQSVIANLVAARRAVLTFARRHLDQSLLLTQATISYQSDGKPELRFSDTAVTQAFAGFDVSLTDGGGVSVAFIGPTPVGVDIEIVEARDAETWRGLLSDDGYALAHRLTIETAESFDRAATRVWTLLEAGKKANGLKRILPRYESSLGGSWLSCVGTADLQPLDFLSGTFTLPGENNAAVVLTVTTRPFHGMGEPRAGC